MNHHTTIDSSEGLCTLVNTFHVKPGQQAAVVDSLRRVTETLTRTLPGFVAASVHRSLDGAVVINYVQWRTRADFDAMLARPEMRAHMDEVGALATQVVPVLCEVAFVGAL